MDSLIILNSATRSVQRAAKRRPVLKAAEKYLSNRRAGPHGVDARCRCEEGEGDAGTPMDVADWSPDYLRLKCPECRREVRVRLGSIPPAPFWLERFFKWMMS